MENTPKKYQKKKKTSRTPNLCAEAEKPTSCEVNYQLQGNKIKRKRLMSFTLKNQPILRRKSLKD